MNGTQLQRRIETEIRRQKDTQILAKASGDMELVGNSQKKITTLTHKYNDLCKISGLKPKKQRMSVSGYARTKVDIPKYNFNKYNDFINEHNIEEIRNNFDYKGFINEYDKFYNTLNKDEIKNVYNDYSEWFKNETNTSHPIGKFLNKITHYDKLPELIDEKDFWLDENGIQNETSLLDEKHWYRGIANKNPEKVKEYVKDFKEGEFFAGKGINGNGTYVTDSYWYANNFAYNNQDGILYIMPKENAKIIGIDKIATIRNKLTRFINSDDELYINFTTTLLYDDGYLAQILGYDILDLGSHKIVLNRSAIKVVK